MAAGSPLAGTAPAAIQSAAVPQTGRVRTPIGLR